MIRIGTSGWTYADWRGRFYPAGLPQNRWLEYYAEHFDTVELNATTYRLPARERIGVWCRSVPAGFVYTVKLSRLITHRASLPPRVDEFVENYMNRADGFAPDKIAQILVQFPPYLKREDRHLRAFLEKLPDRFRYVVEFRDPSWHVAEVERMLEARGMALCIHDYPGFRMKNVVTTPSLAYVRLHGYEGLYAGSYPRRALKRWAARIRELSGQARDVFVYFNNDKAAAAPFDAKQLQALF